MRMRKKPNLDTRMEKCSDLIEQQPEELKGKWLAAYPEYNALEIELGCGKGRFTAETSLKNSGILLVAIERAESALIMALEKVENNKNKNVRFIDGDVSHLSDIFENGEANTIYINFCDPWPKSRDAKFRLTAPNFLRRYADILKTGGEIQFKTDNTPLFTWSLEQFKNEGWELHDVTNNLHANGPVGIMTDYEARFYEEGLSINRLVAKKTAQTKTTANGEVPRLRNSALSDARNC